MRKILLLLSLLILGACTPFNYAPPPATPVAVTIAYPPTLGWMESALQNCAEETPGMILRVEERVSPGLEEADVFLSLGPPSEGVPGYATLLGRESLVVIANPATDPDSVDIATIRRSYTSLEPPFQAWTYPQGYTLRQIFASTLLEGSYAPGVLVAPDPEAILEAIIDHEDALGFLPKANLDGDVQAIPLPEDIEEELALPLIAFTAAEPEGILSVYLGCLSNQLGKAR